ncbi:MAG: hypothetical protein ACRC33_22675 [Gemmataceae bacterium]
MALPPAILNSTCKIIRPFGGAQVAAGVPCKMLNAVMDGRNPIAAALMWTTYMYVDDTIDVRDGCSRGVGMDLVLYADGDEVQIGSVRYVVVWVEKVRDTPSFLRVFLLRHSVTWPMT